MCAYVHPPWRLHLSGVGVPEDRSTILCWRCSFPVPSSFIDILVWSTEPFWLAALSCSHTGSGQNNDLTSLMCVSLSKHGPSFTIIRRRLRSALHREPICLWRLHSREGSQSNYERLSNYKLQYWIQSLAKYLRRSACSDWT